jgi:hypothetical protein
MPNCEVPRYCEDVRGVSGCEVCQSFDACEDDRMRQCCASGKVKVL